MITLYVLTYIYFLTPLPNDAGFFQILHGFSNRTTCETVKLLVNDSGLDLDGKPLERGVKSSIACVPFGSRYVD